MSILSSFKTWAAVAAIAGIGLTGMADAQEKENL